MRQRHPRYHLHHPGRNRSSGGAGLTSLASSASVPAPSTAARKDEFSVTISKAGFEPQTLEVKTRPSEEGKSAMAGNIVAGGLIGAGLDAANGADLDHFPNPIQATLVPVKRTAR